MNDADLTGDSRVSPLPSGNDTVVIQADIPHISPQVLFDYWTQPPLLAQWWPPQAEVEPRAGGRYHFAWSQQGWDLRGAYEAFEPGSRLEFTWEWDHTPGTLQRHVTVDFEREGDGTRLTVRHGTYRESPEDVEERQGHIDGWMFFLNRLANLETPSSPD